MIEIEKLTKNAGAFVDLVRRKRHNMHLKINEKFHSLGRCGIFGEQNLSHLNKIFQSRPHFAGKRSVADIAQQVLWLQLIMAAVFNRNINFVSIAHYLPEMLIRFFDFKRPHTDGELKPLNQFVGNVGLIWWHTYKRPLNKFVLSNFKFRLQNVLLFTKKRIYQFSKVAPRRIAIDIEKL